MLFQRSDVDTGLYRERSGGQLSGQHARQRGGRPLQIRQEDGVQKRQNEEKYQYVCEYNEYQKK